MTIYFVDFEASGLGPLSFPVELGWAWVEDNHVEARNLLIRPVEEWTANGCPGWDPAAEALHGLPIARIEQSGLSPRLAAAEFTSRVGIGEISFDTGQNGQDRKWLERVFSAADVPQELSLRPEATGTMILSMAEKAGVGDVAWTALECLGPKATHQAAVDASRWAWWPIAISRVSNAGLAGISNLNQCVELIRPVVGSIEIRGSTGDLTRLQGQSYGVRVTHRDFLPW